MSRKLGGLGAMQKNCSSQYIYSKPAARRSLVSLASCSANWDTALCGGCAPGASPKLSPKTFSILRLIARSRSTSSGVDGTFGTRTECSQRFMRQKPTIEERRRNQPKQKCEIKSSSTRGPISLTHGHEQKRQPIP